MRPKKPDDERRTEQIRIRLTREEKQRLEASARKAGLDVSTWLRWLGLQQEPNPATKASR